MRRLLTLAVLAALPGGARAQVLSPGPLSSPHADLDDDDECGQCHSGGKQVVADKCLACHADLGKRVRAGTGLHGRAYRGKACESCHVEHYGRGARLVRWPSGARENLDHDLTGWKLEGDHAAAGCTDCHKGTTRGGRTTFLGAPSRCDGCHRDVHQARFGAACASCHDTADWKRVRLDRFDHRVARYRLEGKHVQVACKTCHGEPPRYQGIRFAACTDCHRDPHAGRFKKTCEACHTVDGWAGAAAQEQLRRDHPGLSLRGGHRAVPCERCHDRGNDRPPAKGRACVDCHRVVHEAPFGKRCESCHASIQWLGLGREAGLAVHDRTPYRLEGKHTAVACAGCHPPQRPADQRFRRLVFDRCAACHGDRHAGEFQARAGGECAGCHDPGGFAPARFGTDQHASTAYALDGRHLATPCASCHPGSRPRLDWRQPRRTCAECHANPHGDQFARGLAAGGCASCHITGDWRQPRVDHSAFPLTGAHTRAPCAGCHGAAAGAPAAYRGLPRTCDGCHEDVHAGQFRQRQPVRACADCHGDEVFAVPAFDHAARTRWPIEGKHRAVACAGCHRAEELRNGARAVRYRLGYSRCRDCHADPHQAGPADQDCSQCHSVAGWTASDGVRGGGFDHDRTGFPLRGGHRVAACGGCHQGRGAPPRDCASCHRDAHQRRLGTTCAECHTPAAWSDTEALARHRRTRLPLTGEHALLDCAACHRRGGERPFSSTPADCFACHATDYRRDLHPDHDGEPGGPAPLPRDCGRCHRPTGWSPAVVDPGVLRARRAATRSGHDARFAISFGAHRRAGCADCHPSMARPALVRCDGCHDTFALRRQHRRIGAAVLATSCLRCHPGGLAR